MSSTTSRGAIRRRGHVNRSGNLELNPAELKRKIARCQDRLLEFANRKPEGRREVGYPPGHPFKRTFSWKEVSRTSLLRQPVAASRTS